MAFDFMDWGSWGLVDFYDDTEAELREAMESGRNFDTHWHGFKKTEYSLRIVRDDQEMTVCVHQNMDSAFDEAALIYDCLTSEEEDKLTDEMIDEIQDILCFEPDFMEECDGEMTLDRNDSFDDIVQTATELAQACDNKLTDAFHFCIGTTLQVTYGDSEETTRLIEQRIKDIG